MGKVGIQFSVKRKSGAVPIEGRVGAGVVFHRGGCHSRNEFIDVADSLGWAEGVAGPVAVEFPEGLVVIVVVPFGLGEEVAEGGDEGAGGGWLVWRGDGGEGAEVHEGDYVGCGEVEAGEVGLEAGEDGRREGFCVGGLGVGGYGGVVVVWGFEGGAEAVFHGVVGGVVFGDGEDGVGEGVWDFGEAVLDQGGVVALGEFLGGFDYPILVGRTDEGGVVPGEVLVAVVEVDARVDHLLLAEGGELVGAEGVFVRFDELVAWGVGGDIALDFPDEGLVEDGFAHGGISSPVTGEDLGRDYPATVRDGWVDLGGHREEGGVLAP